MILQGQVGAVSAADGSYPNVRQGKLGDVIVSELNGRYYENNYRGNVFTASTVAAGSTVVAANVSPVAAGAAALFAIYNPAGNSKNFQLLRAKVATISGTPGGPFVFNVIANPAGITAAANITPINNANFKATGSTANVYAQTALTGSVLSSMFRVIGGNAAIAAGAAVNSVEEETTGDIIIAPGTALIVAATATGTSHVASVSLTWAELPL